MSRRVVLITGGSRGIGAATARLAAREGYSVAIGYHSGHEAAQQVAAGLDTSSVTVRGDVSLHDDVARMFGQIDESLGPVTDLVNNAGTLEGSGRVTDVDAHRLARVLEVNVVGPWLCSQQAMRRMSTALGGPGGSIVNVSSAASRLGSPGEYVHYATSKGALDTFTIGLAREAAGEGIRVNAVRPGFIDTEIHARGGDPDRLARIAPGLPLGRPGGATEVAEAIIWLLSERASYVTGAFIDMAGGL